MTSKPDDLRLFALEPKSDRFFDEEWLKVENIDTGQSMIHFGIDRKDGTIIFYPTVPQPSNSIRFTPTEAIMFAGSLIQLARKAMVAR